MKRSDEYDDAEEYLNDNLDDIERDYGKPYNRLTKTEQLEVIIKLFFGGDWKYEDSARKLRDGISGDYAEEIAYISSKEKPVIHKGLTKEERWRVRAHEETYLKEHKKYVETGQISRTEAIKRARKAEHEGMAKKEIQQYEGRLGAKQRRFKQSIVKLQRKRYMPHGRVYRKHRVLRDKKGRFKKWLD